MPEVPEHQHHHDAAAVIIDKRYISEQIPACHAGEKCNKTCKSTFSARSFAYPKKRKRNTVSKEHVLMERIKPCSAVHKIKRYFCDKRPYKHLSDKFFKCIIRYVRKAFGYLKCEYRISQTAYASQPVISGGNDCSPHVVAQHEQHSHHLKMKAC